MFTWLLHSNVNIEEELDAVGDQSRPPVNHKHHGAAEHGSEQRQPHVIVLVRRSPTCTCMFNLV